MNYRQRIAVAVGVVLIALCGLIPPYYGKRDNLRTDVGYRLIFTPPSPRTVAEAFGHSNIEDGFLPYYHARIATDRVLIQMGTVLLVTLGAVALLAERKHAAS